MLDVSDLWMSILVATVLVFVASSIVHMVVQWHNSDYGALPEEEDALDALRKQPLAPGTYMFPYCADMKEMGNDETRKKFERGPVGTMTVMPNGMPAMGGMLGQWALYLLLISFFVAYVVAAALPAGSDYYTVFRVAGATAFLPFVLANVPASIWWGQPWSTTMKYAVDGVVYTLLVAGTFAGFWPGA